MDFIRFACPFRPTEVPGVGHRWHRWLLGPVRQIKAVPRHRGRGIASGRDGRCSHWSLLLVHRLICLWSERWLTAAIWTERDRQPHTYTHTHTHSADTREIASFPATAWTPTFSRTSLSVKPLRFVFLRDEASGVKTKQVET